MYSLTKYQHGFRTNHSIETALLHFVNNIYKMFEDKLYVVRIFIDLFKAFDSLNHNYMFDKLKHVLIRGLLIGTTFS